MDVKQYKSTFLIIPFSTDHKGGRVEGANRKLQLKGQSKYGSLCKLLKLGIHTIWPPVTEG
jgi:hypothetical protein